jgi:hypothetical protein
MLNSAASPNRKPEALVEFKHQLDRIINEARQHHVDPRMLGEWLDTKANALRCQWSLTAPHGHAL